MCEKGARSAAPRLLVCRALPRIQASYPRWSRKGDGGIRILKWGLELGIWEQTPIVGALS